MKMTLDWLYDNFYVCGDIADAFDSPTNTRQQYNNRPSCHEKSPSSPLVPSDLCASKALRRSFSTGSLISSSTTTNYTNELEEAGNNNNISSIFARALVKEVNSPNAMTPSEMAAREKQLLQAQERAKRNKANMSDWMKQISWGTGWTESEEAAIPRKKANAYPPNQLVENRARLDHSKEKEIPTGKHTVTIGLSLSRRHTIGHPDTVTRQTAFDFNELQDRAYKYVSSTDASGWRAGGGERGGVDGNTSPTIDDAHKIACPDTVHIPIIQIDADSPAVVDSIIASLARGEVFIPHMSVLPEALSVNGVSPPDLIVRFGCERNEDSPPDEWPNWSLEFMHNQLYEYFAPLGARWMKRPFQITLAHKVRWRTVKHMNKYFAHAERVISAWREKGPQYMNPQLSYIEGGATPEEVSRPHGIYLMRDGRPTNYFCPNLEPPYTTKMTRSLLLNVLDKSWDRKRRDWSSEPLVSRIAPSILLGAMCGCDNTGVTGFMPSENRYAKVSSQDRHKLQVAALDSPPTIRRKAEKEEQAAQQQKLKKIQTPNKNEFHEQNWFSPTNSHHSQTINEVPVTLPLISETGASDIPERLSDVFLEKPITPTQQTKLKEAQPPKPEELASYKETPTSHEEVCTSFKEAIRAPSHNSQANQQQMPKAKESKNFAASPKNADKLISRTNENKNNSNASVGESHTTEPISNSSHFLISKEREQRKLRELEMLKERKKMEEIEEAIRRKGEEHKLQQKIQEKREYNSNEESMFRDVSSPSSQQRASPLSQRVSPASSHNQSQPSPKSPQEQYENMNKHKEKRDTNLIEDTEHRNQQLTSPQPKTGNPPSQPNHEQFENFFATNFFNESPPKQNIYLNNQQPNKLYRVNSADTLEYSLDSFSINNANQHHYDGGSVTTLNTATGQSLISYVTRSTQHTQRTSEESYYEPIPTDEELYTIGWAKALDTKSGSYYYFTLDRRQIVWENPLRK